MEKTFPLETPSDIKIFLENFSKNFNKVFDIKFLAKGGEGIVFFLETLVFYETVAKVTLN